MMLKRISLITSLLFILLGANVFAESITSTSGRTESKTSQLNKSAVHAPKESAALTVKSGLNEPSLKEYIIPGAVTFVIIAGLGSYWLFYRRKHV